LYIINLRVSKDLFEKVFISKRDLSVKISIFLKFLGNVYGEIIACKYFCAKKRAWRRTCEDASSSHSSPMKGPLKLLMKTPLHRPIDPSTHGPFRLAALVAAHLRKGILNCSDLQGSQVFALDSVLKFQREVFGSMAKPSPSATAIVTLNFQVFCQGKVDKLIARHLQALECLLHS